MTREKAVPTRVTEWGTKYRYSHTGASAARYIWRRLSCRPFLWTTLSYGIVKASCNGLFAPQRTMRKGRTDNASRPFQSSFKMASESLLTYGRWVPETLVRQKRRARPFNWPLRPISFRASRQTARKMNAVLRPSFSDACPDQP